VVVDAVLAKNLPHRSRENEFNYGRVYEFRPVKDTMSFRREDGLERVFRVTSCRPRLESFLAYG
jgi:hypothetical protein